MNRQRHQLLGFIAGEAEHQALVASALVEVEALAFVHALRDVLRLLAVLHHDGGGISVKADRGIGIADAPDRFACNVGEINFRAGGDFTRQHDQIVFDQGFSGDAGAFVLR